MITVETSKYNNNVYVLRLRGRLDVNYADTIEEKLSELIDTGKYYLIIDLTEVNYIGSSTIKVLLGMQRKLEKFKGFIKILNMPTTGLKIIEAMGIKDRFKLCDSEEEAARV